MVHGFVVLAGLDQGCHEIVLRRAVIGAKLHRTAQMIDRSILCVRRECLAQTPMGGGRIRVDSQRFTKFRGRPIELTPVHQRDSKNGMDTC